MNGRAPRRPPTAAWLVAAGLVSYAAAAIAVRVGPPVADASVFRALNDVGDNWTRLFDPVSRLTLPVALTLAAVGTAAFVVLRTRSLAPLVAGAAAGLTAWIVANAAKLMVDRPRPYGTLTEAVLRQSPAHGTSFPSSHTAVTVAVVTALMPFLPKPARFVAIAYAILVAWSRVYLGVHYPLDVIAGAGIGLAVGGAVMFVSERRTRRQGRTGAAPSAISPLDESDP